MEVFILSSLAELLEQINEDDKGDIKCIIGLNYVVYLFG